MNSSLAVYNCYFSAALLIDPLHKWRLHLNNNTLYILSLVLMFSDKGFFHMNVRLRMYKLYY